MKSFETRGRVVHTHTHTHTRVLSSKDWRTNVVLQFEKGGVKLDKALTRDRL